MTYRIRFTKQAQKDVNKLTPKLQEKLKDILRNRIARHPHSGKALSGDLKGYYSVRLSLKDRIVYTVRENELLVLVVRAKTHYGE
ncbi:MAG: type II toxin-antitoxin system mRNA interferase toxin, RelE/StbE family [Verrucomicrobia bacterium]|nr:type II toxin-antitoxin system mRNA interferase toxin, RelE/StbE family [Verrucomicrobiota bacterium]MCH8527697.1 type II toxin-antitoxin system mRNA interferase toxin, RelE/StbE family [Kiritimatiellia bacterium]